MAEQVEAWRCEHCRRFRRAQKQTVEAHEKRCFSNPATKTCKTCAHSGIEIEDFPMGTYDGVVQYSYENVRHCCIESPEFGTASIEPHGEWDEAVKFDDLAIDCPDWIGRTGVVS
jgi:hypothetical protein